jgi:anti-sigma B factor antagonist
MRHARPVAPGEQMRQNPWEITTTVEGHSLVVRPDGEIDIYTAPDLARALRDCSDGHELLICDLSAVSFIDSSGIQTLIEAAQREPRLVIRDPSAPVEKLLVLTGIETLFQRIDRRDKRDE